MKDQGWKLLSHCTASSDAKQYLGVFFPMKKKSENSYEIAKIPIDF